MNLPLPANFRLGLTTSARSGTRYNVTSGRDDNGDTVFNDRPAGVGRNSAVTAGSWDVGVTPIGYSGVLTSPFFGQPTAAMPSRRVDVGMRIGF